MEGGWGRWGCTPVAYDAASPSMVVKEARILMIHKFRPKSLYSLDLNLQHQDSSLPMIGMKPGPASGR